MDIQEESSEARFAAYVESLAQVLGHEDRAGPLRDYCTGLLMPGERKSVEPMAAIVAPARVGPKHQSLLHFVGQGPWSDEALLAKVRELALPAIETQGKIEAWIVDDTGFAKKGVHSVGVARQYCGRLGKTDNCQIAVTLSIANHAASLPIAYRLYLPEDWARDAGRRGKTHVPEAVKFQTKPAIALDQIRAALAAGVAPGVVLTDAAYGTNGAFRTEVTGMGLLYAVGVQANVVVWPPGVAPALGNPSGRARARARLRGEAEPQPMSVKALAKSLPASAWAKVAWREGSNAPLESRFAALRVRPASSRDKAGALAPHEWLLVEWPEGETEPSKYWLSTLPETTSLAALVDMAKLRWRIERDYEELKSELGLAHFEGRGWRGFHHHASLCIAAYGFLIRERAAIPPSGPWRGEKPPLSKCPRRRGSPDPARASRRQLDRDDTQNAHRRPRKISRSMSLLPCLHIENNSASAFVMQ